MKIGDVVCTIHDSNGHKVQPATVTMVWDQYHVNAKVFPDCSEPFDKTSMHVYLSKEEALATGDENGCWIPQETDSAERTY